MSFKSFYRFFWCALIALGALWVWPAAAQSTTNILADLPIAKASTNSNAGGNGKGNANGLNKPSIGSRPIIISPDAGAGDSNGSGSSSGSSNGNGNGNSNGNGNGNGNGNQPARSGVTDPPAQVKDLVKQFQAARDAYLQQQKDLQRLSKTATEDERAAIRQQMKDSLDAWKEEQRQLRQEMKERAKELKQELQGDLGRVVDGGQGEGRGR